MKIIYDDLIAIYYTANRLSKRFVERLKEEVDKEFPGIDFQLKSTDDMTDKVEVDCKGTEFEEAFLETKEKIGNRILDIIDRLKRSRAASA
jgi:hypothetical protein